MNAAANLSLRKVVVLGACQAPGALLAKSYVRAGARVVAIGQNAATLWKMQNESPEAIEPLAVQGCNIEALKQLRGSWGSDPIHSVINLMPLVAPADINSQLSGLTEILRVMGPGIIGGGGSIVSVAAKPVGEMSLARQGLCAALSACGDLLGQELSSNGVRFHTVLARQNAINDAIPTVLFLTSAKASRLASTTIQLN